MQKLKLKFSGVVQGTNSQSDSGSSNSSPADIHSQGRFDFVTGSDSAISPDNGLPSNSTRVVNLSQEALLSVKQYTINAEHLIQSCALWEKANLVEAASCKGLFKFWHRTIKFSLQYLTLRVL